MQVQSSQLTNILVVYFALSLFIKKTHLFILQNTLLYWFYSLQQFKCFLFTKTVQMFMTKLKTHTTTYKIKLCRTHIQHSSYLYQH